MSDEPRFIGERDWRDNLDQLVKLAVVVVGVAVVGILLVKHWENLLGIGAVIVGALWKALANLRTVSILLVLLLLAVVGIQNELDSIRRTIVFFGKRAARRNGDE